MSKKTTNENMVTNSDQPQKEQKQIINELIITEIQCFELEDIIETPTNEEIEIWKKISDGNRDDGFLSEEIEELWREEIRREIESMKDVDVRNLKMNERTKKEEMKSKINKSQIKEDLYRVTYVYNNGYSICDIDGVPFDIMVFQISLLSGCKDITKLNIKYLDEEELKEPTHFTSRFQNGIEYKTIGDLFYSEWYQEMVRVVYMREE